MFEQRADFPRDGTSSIQNYPHNHVKKRGCKDGAGAVGPQAHRQQKRDLLFKQRVSHKVLLGVTRQDKIY